MKSVDPTSVEQFILQFKQLKIEGQNIIGGGSSDAGHFRGRYLRWCHDVERLLNQVGMSSDLLARLQNPRHRSLVADEVLPDQLYREVSAQVAMVSQELEDALITLQKPAAVQEFVGDSGAVYRYDLNSPLGEGGFGAVFGGSVLNGSPVAIKVVPLGARGGDRRLAVREAEIARQLKSQPDDHLVHVVDIAETDSELILVMPKAEQSLAERIALGPVSDAEVKEILTQLARGLVTLYKAAVVHRDIKPQNILLLSGRWCLADFGISRNTTVATATYTWRGTGTLEYMAPELWRGEPANAATDLYALGCVAFEMLTGEAAFPGPDFRDQHLTIAPSLPYAVEPGLASIILSLLAKDAAGRPEDPRQLLERLERQGLTAGQKDLQGVVALMDRNDLEAQGRTAIAQERYELQHQGLMRITTTWRSLDVKFKEVIPSATAEVDTDQFTLDFRGNSVVLSITLVTPPKDSPPSELDLLLVGTLMVKPRSPSDVLIACNVLFAWHEDQPFLKTAQYLVEEERWSPSLSAATTMKRGLPTAVFEELWKDRSDRFTARDLVQFEDFTDETLMSLIAGTLRPYLETDGGRY